MVRQCSFPLGSANLGSAATGARQNDLRSPTIYSLTNSYPSTSFFRFFSNSNLRPRIIVKYSPPGVTAPPCLGDGSKTCYEPSNFRINSRDHNRDTLVLRLELLLVFPLSFGERALWNSPLEDGKTAGIILKREFVI